MPLLVSSLWLLVKKEISILSNQLNVRKEMESCLPATFQFWAIREIQKHLDEKTSLFVYGGHFLKENNKSKPTNKGFLAMLLVAHISIMKHFSEDF